MIDTVATEQNVDESRNEIDTPVIKSDAGDNRPHFNGRTVIYADYEQIDETNVIDALNFTLPAAKFNFAQIDYLWNYYKGVQPILGRTKDVRPEICNKIVENHAQEIVMFKIGYQLAEPLQYTCRTYEGEEQKEGGDNPRLNDVNELNTLMFAEDKDSCDRDLFEWMCVGGLGYRMAEADEAEDIEDGGAPFEIYTLDPRITYVVYSSAHHHKPIMAVWIGKDVHSDKTTFSCFTKDKFFRIVDNSISNGKGAGEIHTYNAIPIVEYRLNNARMGVFEPVLPLLDAINAVESNRLDGIEQTIQALMKFVNCAVTEDEFVAMLQLGAVQVTSTDDAQGKAEVDVIKNDLDQTSTQVTKEDLYQAIVNICGMPNRNGQGGSTSDTGAAVLLRDGWTLAESHAKSYELQFKRAERNFLRVILNICKQAKEIDLSLRIRDIELTFNRRNYENILVKSQVLTTMLTCDKIHPQLAFQACGLFTDPEAAYLQSKQYMDEQKANAPALPEPAPIEPKSIGSQAGVPEPQGNNAANAAIA